jgi:hypothetical protein
MTDTQTPPDATADAGSTITPGADVTADAGGTITPGLVTPYLALGPYTTLQEAVARLSRNPIGLVLDEAGQPLTVVTRDTLLSLIGGGKDAARAHGKMGARQQARERREGLETTRSLLSLREELPPLVQAEVGAGLTALAEQVRSGDAAGVLVRQDGKPIGVLLARALLRRVPEPESTPDATPAPAAEELAP